VNQRAIDAMRHRTGMDRPAIFYLYAIPCTAGAVFLTWLTFRNGIAYLIADNQPFLIWAICMMVLVSLWRARPRKQKQDIRLNLN
jgi:hypothetical protein